MPIDPNIVLAIRNPQEVALDYQKIVGLRQQNQADQQALQKQNFLQQLLAQPDAIDKDTGLPSTNTLAKITRVDPAAGLKIAAEISQIQERKVVGEHTQSETMAARQKANTEALSESLGLYDAEMKSGGVSPEIAQQNLRKRLHDHIMAEPVSEDDKRKLWDGMAGMKPEQLRVLATTAQQRIETDKLEKERTPMVMGGKPVNVDKLGNVYDPNSGEKIKVTGPLGKETTAFDPAKAAAAAANKAPQLLKDSDGTNYLGYFGPKGTKPEYTDLQGQPYTPKTASHISSGAPRSAAAMAVQRYLEEHPDATYEDLAKVNADLGKQAKAERDFATGKQGQAVNSFNVGIAHLNTLDGLVSALGNTDVKFVNRAKQRFTEEFGATAPTNFDAAKAIVGDEIIKAIVGGGGALADRENAQNQLDRAKTPAQLRGVIKTYKDLMGGQLKGLEKQYQTSTGQDDFNEKLLPDTKRELGITDEHHQHGAGGTHEVPQALMDTYGKITDAAKKATARDRLKAAGYDVSGLK